MSRWVRHGVPAAVSVVLAAVAGVLGNAFSNGWPLPVGVGLAVMVVLVASWEGWLATRLVNAQPKVEPSSPSLVDSVSVPGGRNRDSSEGVSPAVSWPLIFGLLPQGADRYQDRSVATELRQAVAVGTTVVTHVLSGLGGVGKTQLAAAHARRALAEHEVDLLMWITAASRQEIIADYAQAAVEILGADPADAERAAQRFLTWLTGTDKRWLIVLDDLADISALDRLWPPTTAFGAAIVTTRRRDAALEGRVVVDVGLFTPVEAAAYLRSKLPDEPADQLGLLAADLGYLPLALAHAATVISNKQLTCSQYRKRFADRTKTLSDVMPEPEDGLPDNYRLTIAATWSISIEDANRLRPSGVARPLLALASLLDPNGIPTSLFATSSVLDYLTSHRTTGESAPIDADAVIDAAHNLRRLSLVTVDRGAGRLRVHALVQRATRELTPPDQLNAAAEAAADALLHIWPADEKDRILSTTLRSCVMVLRDYAEDQLWGSDAHPILFRLGDSLGAIGLAGAALAHWQQMLEQAEQRLGPDHASTLKIRGNVARWRGQAGDPAGAVTAFQLLLPDLVREHGSDHPDVLTARGNLARWQGYAGDPSGAVTFYGQLLQDMKSVLGPDHADTLATRHNLAKWRGHAGDPARAVIEFTDLLNDRLHLLGANHPDTLTTRHNIARWHGAAGNPERAVAEAEALLPDLEIVLGPDHPDTLIARSSMCAWRAHVEPARALADTRQLLADRTRILGPDHPDTLTSRHDLAVCRLITGDAEGALTDFETLRNDRTQVLGPHHPDTLVTRHFVARCLWHTGQAAEARAAITEVLEDRRRILAPDHPDLRATELDLDAWS